MNQGYASNHHPPYNSILSGQHLEKCRKVVKRTPHFLDLDETVWLPLGMQNQRERYWGDSNLCNSFILKSRSELSSHTWQTQADPFRRWYQDLELSRRVAKRLEDLSTTIITFHSSVSVLVFFFRNILIDHPQCLIFGFRVTIPLDLRRVKSDGPGTQSCCCRSLVCYSQTYYTRIWLATGVPGSITTWTLRWGKGPVPRHSYAELYFEGPGVDAARS